jgi:hypothetical protein
MTGRTLAHAAKRAIRAKEDVEPTAAAAIDVRRAVEVFRRFAALPVEDAESPEEDGDGVLAQFGTYGFRGQPEFSTDLTRQLVEVGGEDAPTWQLSCTLYWRPESSGPSARDLTTSSMRQSSFPDGRGH